LELLLGLALSDNRSLCFKGFGFSISAIFGNSGDFDNPLIRVHQW
jgi:hypothetical protein